LNDVQSLKQKSEEVLKLFEDRIDILVNNGGISMWDFFENLELKTIEQIMNVNYASHAALSNYFAQSLIKS